MPSSPVRMFVALSAFGARGRGIPVSGKQKRAKTKGQTSMNSPPEKRAPVIAGPGFYYDAQNDVVAVSGPWKNELSRPEGFEWLGVKIGGKRAWYNSHGQREDNAGHTTCRDIVAPA